MTGSQRGIEGLEFGKTGEDPKSPSKSSQKLRESLKEFTSLDPPSLLAIKNISLKNDLPARKFQIFPDNYYYVK